VLKVGTFPPLCSQYYPTCPPSSNSTPTVYPRGNSIALEYFPPHYMHLKVQPQTPQRENQDTQEHHQSNLAQHGQQQNHGGSSPAYSQPEEYNGTSISGSEWSLSSTPTGQDAIWMKDGDTSGIDDSVATLTSCDREYDEEKPNHTGASVRKGFSPLQDMPEGVLI